MNILSRITFTSGLPAYADAAAGGFYAQSLSEAQAIQLPSGRVALPALVNDVRVSRGGKWAWQRHDTGDIYEGLTRVGPGWGRGSFLYVGEILTLKTGPFPPDQGWAYVDASGRIVTNGECRTNPPLAIAVKYADIWIGQGQESGLCCYIPGESSPRLILAGNADFCTVDRLDDVFILTVTNDAAHVATVFTMTLAELRACPFVTTQPAPASSPQPLPSPLPEPTPMSVAPNLSSLLNTVASHYNLADNSLANCAAIVHEFVEAARQADPQWGYISKVAGETQYEGRSQDSAAYGQASPVSVKLISGAGDPHPVQLVWVEGGGLRATDHWLYPDSATFAPTPAPPAPSAPPASVPDIPVTPTNEPDLAAVLAAVQANGAKIDHITAQVNAFVAEVKQYLPAVLAVVGSGSGSSALSSLLSALTTKKSA